MEDISRWPYNRSVNRTAMHLQKITHLYMKKTGELLYVFYVPSILLTVIYLHLSNIIFSIQKVSKKQVLRNTTPVFFWDTWPTVL